MKRLGIVLLALLMLGATGCSRIKLVPLDQAHMQGASFSTTTAKIKAGTKLKFINDSTVTHILVVGDQGKWTSTPGAPSELDNSNGQLVSGGQEIDIVFPTAGTYTVTCTVHPAMLLTVTVQ
jgi:plastocyanin